jgi:hypothetical protein
MAVLRQFNALGQARIDTPHVRLMEQGVAGDLDALAGEMLAGGLPTVLRGFTIVSAGVTQASQLSLRVAGGRVLHPTASSSGTLYTVPDDETDEALAPTNPHVDGSFSANQVNFVGLDLVRQTDDSTVDTVMFLSSATLQESPRRVPLARTLQRRIVITTIDPASTPGLAPIARITTDASNNVVTIQDARNMLFRLGQGGGQPNATYAYPWVNGRTDSTDFTLVGDKQLTSAKDWFAAVMTRLWELGGGERWFSPTADRNVTLTGLGSAFVSSGEHFEWTGTNLHWQGLGVLFSGSTGYINEIKDQTGNSSGLTDLADGECVYVDLDRTGNRTGGAALQAVKGTLASLGSPTVPGARWVFAWRRGASVYYRGKVMPIGASNVVAATTTQLGTVLLSGTPASAPSPIAAALDASNRAMVAGLTRAGSIAGIGAGTLTLGPDTSSDTGLAYGNTSMASQLFDHAAGASPSATQGVVVRNNTDANSSPNTRNFLFRQLHSATMKDVLELDGAGALRFVTALYTPPSPASGTAKVFFRLNGLSTPNSRLQLCVMWSDGSVTAIAESPAS